MCFHMSYALQPDTLEARFSAVLKEPELYSPHYYVAAFNYPQCPIITNEDPEHIQMYEWSLIPFWAKGEEKAEGIRKYTGNARDDTIFEKPSFKHSIMKRRCLVLTDGFYEWREFKGKNYPYYIRLKDQQPFAFAGIWDKWSNNGDTKFTFSIITTDANELLAFIHNKKKRMPVILEREEERDWIDKGLSRQDIQGFLRPYDDDQMKGYTISKLISIPGKEKDVPAIIKPFEYTELKVQQSTLF